MKTKILLLFLILQFLNILILNNIYAKEDAVYWYNKGVDATDLDKKIEYYTKAIELNPEDALAYNNRGIAYADKGLYDEAINDYNKAIEIGYGGNKVKLAKVYINRGNAYAKLGNCLKANEDYKKACELGLEKSCSYTCY